MTRLAGHTIPLTSPSPGEDDTTYCKRAFGGRTFECKICGATIHWPGVCMACSVNLTEPKKEPTLSDKLRAAGVPERYCSWTWDGVTRTDESTIKTLWAWRGDPSLVSLAGAVGSGKTGASIAALGTWVASRGKGRWIYWPTWLSELRDAEATGDGSHYLANAISRFDGLVVADEILGPRETAFSIEHLLRFLDLRLGEGLPTIITTNGMPPSFSAPDQRIASRLASGLVIPWNGKDRRRQRDASDPTPDTSNVQKRSDAAS